METPEKQTEPERVQTFINHRVAEGIQQYMASIGMESMRKQAPPTTRDDKVFRKPPTYNGERDMHTLYNWIRILERYLQVKAVPLIDYVLYASSFLDKDVQTWFNQQMDSEEISWAQFKSRIIARFSDPTQQDSILDKWDRATQRDSVSEYCRYFDNLFAILPEEFKSGYRVAPQ